MARLNPTGRLPDAFGNYFRIDKPVAVILHRYILPMEFLVVDPDENPLSVFISGACQNDHFTL
ncbi:hypothetical protein, partial [Alistipes sp.]|uniref:hypothetical protein n=1 Tax=Alistipes sp. TaxID=1872444 RepID=UPI003AB05374